MNRVRDHVDRAAAVREALRRLVARRGFHGASMSAVAAEAHVATGTAYVHYESKDDLVLAAYVEAKRELGLAAFRGVDPAAPPAARFRQLWLGVFDHLRADPDRARFLLQVDSSPYAERAHDLAMATNGDPLMAEAVTPDLDGVLVRLPPMVLYDLAVGPILRTVASGRRLSTEEREAMAEACWRAITRGDPTESR